MLKLKIKSVYVLLSLFLLSYSCTQQNKPTHLGELGQAIKTQTCESVLPIDSAETAKQENNALFFYYKGICENRTGNYVESVKSLKRSEELNNLPGAGLYINIAASEAMLDNQLGSFEYLDKLAQLGYKNHKILDRKDFDSLRADERFQRIYTKLKPSYNLWTSLFLFVSLQALFVGILLFGLKRSQTHANRLLAILMLAFAIVIFSFTLYWTGFNLTFPYLNNWYHLLPYAAGPLFYIYTRNVVQNRNFERKDGLHFIPVVLCATLISPWLLNNYVNLNLENVPNIVGAIGRNPVTKILSLATYTLLSFKLIKTVSTKQQNIKTWLKYLVMAFAGYLFTMATYYILVRFSFFSPTWDYGISFALSFFIFIVSFMGYLQPRVFAGETVEEILQPTKYQRTGLTDLAEITLKKQLEEVMKVEKVYRNGDLRLNDLADSVNSNRHNVSLVINKHFKGNYFDFLNRFRIEDVKQMMTNSKFEQYTIIEMAYEAGFNNKVSFNKAFKKFTGMTPSAYRKSVLKGAI